MTHRRGLSIPLLAAIRKGARVSSVRFMPRACVRVAATRRAFTLLEVVLALALFFGALAALSQLTWNASRAAVQGRLRTQAVILCETKLNEILAGIEPLTAQSNVAFPDDPNWTWSLAVGPTAYPELLLLEVTVSHTGGSSLGNLSQTLRRWFRDPQVFIDAAIMQEQIDAASSTTSTNGNTSTSGGTP